MAQLDKLETKLDDLLDKKSPVKLPENARKSLAGALWWLALVGGILQLWAAWALWNAGHRLDDFVDAVNSYAAAYGLDYSTTDLGLAFYLGLGVLLASGALLLLAAPGLKAMRKAGWNLVFYSVLVNLAYGVIIAFTRYGSVADLFGAALVSLVGAYLLFQVRGHFMKSVPAAHHKA